MNSPFEAIGTDALAQLISIAEALGLTRIAPASITYHRGRSLSYNPDVGETETWAETATITDVLVGHYRISQVSASAGIVSLADIVVIFPQTALAGEPGPGDKADVGGTTYEYLQHQAAAGLYFVGLSAPEWVRRRARRA